MACRFQAAWQTGQKLRVGIREMAVQVVPSQQRDIEAPLLQTAGFTRGRDQVAHDGFAHLLDGRTVLETFILPPRRQVGKAGQTHSGTRICAGT
jgi:hypothetical protein